MSKPDIRILALIGAQSTLAKLKEQVAEMEETVRLLKQAPAPSKKATAKRTKHTAAFRAKVVALANAQGVADVAKRYGISPNTIYNWRSQKKEGS